MFYYYDSISRKIDQKHINKILITGINNTALRKKILKNISLNNLLNQSKLSISQVYKITKILKYSGFFKYVKLQQIPNQSNKFIIKLFANPIIKTIQIKNINQLYFPQIELSHLLKRQIGYPTNTIILKKIVNNIQSNYYIKGYRWVKINYHINNKSKLMIGINEGKISKVDITCLSNNLTNKAYKQNLDSLIIQKLHISIGRILNYNMIESGIKELKTQKIISNCYYKIQYIDDGNLNIIFKYHLSNTGWLYCFYQIIYLHYYLLNSIQSYSFSYAINKSSYFHKISQCLNLIDDHIFKQKFCYYTRLKTTISLIKKLKFGFHSSAVNQLFSTCTISFEESIHKNIMLFSYIYYHKYKNKYFIDTCTMNINKENIQIDKNRLMILYNYIQPTKYFLQHIVLRTMKLNLLQTLSNTISINQELRFLKQVYVSYIICIINSWQRYFNNINIHTREKNQIGSNTLTSYNLSIISNHYYNKFTNNPKTFWKLSTLVTNARIINSKILPYIHNLNFLINLQYRQTISFFKKNFKKTFNSISLNIKFNVFINNISHQYCSNDILRKLLFLGRIQNSKYTLNKTINTKLKHDIEFYIYREKPLSCFIFISLNKYLIYLDSHLEKIYNNFLGIGIIANLQIKILPTIHVKYEISHKKTYKLYATFSFK